MVLERDDGEGRARKSIPVDEARALPEFFSKSPGRAAYRVAIIDTADDLNPNAANAVLKTLEEPPERGVLLLVSSHPGALLPTIRSRCRRLAFAAPPTEAAVRIGSGSWLGANAVILPGAQIGEHVVVAAGAVVRGEVPDRCVVAGVPARVVRRWVEGRGWLDEKDLALP